MISRHDPVKMEMNLADSMFGASAIPINET
jgi:hypothetical protein